MEPLPPPPDEPPPPPPVEALTPPTAPPPHPFHRKHTPEDPTDTATDPVSVLAGMGFPEAEAKRALEIEGSVERALELLTDGRSLCDPQTEPQGKRVSHAAPATAVQATDALRTLEYHVRVPPNAKPGDKFECVANGTKFAVCVPQGCSEGQRLRLDLPGHLPQSTLGNIKRIEQQSDAKQATVDKAEISHQTDLNMSTCQMIDRHRVASEGVQWQWQKGAGTDHWQTFEQNICEALEKALQAGARQMRVDNERYIDLSNPAQIVQRRFDNSAKKRAVRRIAPSTIVVDRQSYVASLKEKYARKTQYRQP